MTYSPKQEKSLQNAIKDFVKFHGGYCLSILSGQFCLNKGTLYERWVHGAEKGSPDIIACLRGKFISIECKKDEKTANAWIKSKAEHVLQQKQQQALIDKAGGVYLIVGSLGQLQDDLKTLGLL